MIEIYLRNIDSNALIDDEDYDLVKDYNWMGTSIKKETDFRYCKAMIYDSDGEYVEHLLLHRLVMGLHGKSDRQDLITFKDRNRLNCQKNNLELVTDSKLRGV